MRKNVEKNEKRWANGEEKGDDDRSGWEVASAA
jgi:hypothetical protein